MLELNDLKPILEHLQREAKKLDKRISLCVFPDGYMDASLTTCDGDGKLIRIDDISKKDAEDGWDWTERSHVYD